MAQTSSGCKLENRIFVDNWIASVTCFSWDQSVSYKIAEVMTGINELFSGILEIMLLLLKKCIGGGYNHRKAPSSKCEIKFFFQVSPLKSLGLKKMKTRQ